MLTARLDKELRDLKNLPSDYFVGADVCDVSDRTHWKGWIKGPEDSPYENGKFYIDIIFPSEYPFAPPKMKFDTKIWHPNVSSVTGVICLDTLKDEWSPALTIRTALISVQALLTCANPDDPQDGVVAQQYKTNHSLFVKTAREWTEKYAHGSSEGNYVVPFRYQNQLNTLKDMGFGESQSKEALEKTNGDMDKAINILA